jgi:alpha-N-acetylglucosamine transferase
MYDIGVVNFMWATAQTDVSLFNSFEMKENIFFRFIIYSDGNYARRLDDLFDSPAVWRFLHLLVGSPCISFSINFQIIVLIFVLRPHQPQ